MYLKMDHHTKILNCLTQYPMNHKPNRFNIISAGILNRKLFIEVQYINLNLRSLYYRNTIDIHCSISLPYKDQEEVPSTASGHEEKATECHRYK